MRVVFVEHQGALIPVRIESPYWLLTAAEELRVLCRPESRCWTCSTGEKRREEVLLSWRGNERGGVVHVFQCPVGSYSMIFFQAWLSGEKKSFCCLGGGMREGVLFMSSNVLLVPRFFFQAWLSFEFLMI